MTLTYFGHSAFQIETNGTTLLCDLQIEGKTIYNTGDTCRFAEMAWIGEEVDLDLCPSAIRSRWGPRRPCGVPGC